MAAIISEKFRIFNAKQFYESLTEPLSGSDSSSERTRMYFFVGRPQRWYAYLEVYNKSATDFVAGRDKVFVGANFASATFKADVVASYPNSLLLSAIGPTASAVPPQGSTLTGYNPITSSNTAATALTGVYRFATDDIPTIPYDNQTEKYLAYADILAAKRITGEFARPVVRRYNWDISTNSRFDMWRPDYSEQKTSSVVLSGGSTGSQNISTAKFYVVNNKYEVFKCLYNGERPASLLPGGVLPTVAYEPSTTPSSGTYSNGIYKEPVDANGFCNYIWKYMYTITTNDVLRFLSTDFIPIVADGAVQAAAVNGSISTVVLKAIGSDLPTSQTSLYTPIFGDGSGGIVKFGTNSSGNITYAILHAAGTGYTYANVLLTNGNVYSDAALTTPVTVSSTAIGAIECVLSPQGGHGADPIVELNAKRIMTNIRLTYAEGGGDFPVENDFRRIGILQDPYLYGTSNFATVDTLSNLRAIKLTNVTGIFQQDEEITQSLPGGGVAKGTVVAWTLDSGSTTSGVLKYFQSPENHLNNGVVRAFISNATFAVTGQTSNITGTVDTTFNASALGSTFTNGLALPELQPNSGEIIYIENRRLITRAPDQVEDIKLVIEF
jgi:hypothetical protein